MILSRLSAQDFVGEWQLARRIEDRQLKAEGELIGRAVLTQAAPDVLDYRESGELRYADGPPLEASRAYRWLFMPGAVAVSFPDGRPFHDFTPAGAEDGTDHLCGSDLYRVRYDFTRWPQWQAVWSVKGPRKNYTSVSDYAPI